MIDRAELATHGPLRELLPDVGIRRLTHATVERRFQNVQRAADMNPNSSCAGG
jgi:hypothetical protein